jgi:streptogramin lyase
MKSIVLPVLALLTSFATAQVVRGGDLITTDYNSPYAVWRVDHTGAVTSVLSGGLLNGPSGICCARNRDIIVANANNSTLIRIDANTGAATQFASGLGTPLRVCEMMDGDFAVTSATGHSVLRVTPAGIVTTLASGAPFNRPYGVTADLNGDVLVADDIGHAIHRVTPAGGITTLRSGTPLSLPQGVALFPNGDYAVIDGVTDSVYRIDRNTLVLTTWVTQAALNANPEGIVSDGAGGFFISHSGTPSGNGIRAVDALGNVTIVSGNGVWSNLECLVRVPMVSGPRVITTGPGSMFTFTVDDPGSAGDLYTLVLSASVFPGWHLPGSDPRSLFVNPDPFFFATIGQNAPPILVNWTSFLDAQGHATASLDLQIFPAGFLAGLVLYQQGLTLTPQLTMRTAGDPLRLQFQ